MVLVEGPDTAKCLIFDWDGTLVDTRRANYDALANALSDYRVDLPFDWYNARTGVSAAEMIKMLAEELKLQIDLPIDRIVRHKDEIFLKGASSIREITEVADIARQHRGRIPLAVASGSQRRVIEPIMRLTKLDALFDVLITREDAERGKPAPDIFLAAARKLDVLPSVCLVYEDSDEGVIAAREAGMAVVDVRSFLFPSKPL